jgi:AraC-like DNA-binding protein/mannose-6-phosphate isomerase-like protein (cupin superfamily)
MKEAEKQPIILNENESFFVDYVDQQFFTVDWHWHPEFELFLVIEGEGTRFVGDSRLVPFEEGDLVLVGADLPHVWTSGLKHHLRTAPLQAKAYVIQFKKDCFGEGFFEMPEMKPILELLQRAKQGIQFSKEARVLIKDKIIKLVILELSQREKRGIELSKETREWADTKIIELALDKIIKAPNQWRTTRFLTLLEILHDMAHSEKTKSLATPDYKKPEETGDNRLDKVIKYIHDNYTKPISLAVLADIAGLSPSAFCPYFKSYTKRTTRGFRNELRIIDARKLLAKSDKEIGDILLECGFNNESNFYTQFKKYTGCAPDKYRRDQRAR